MMFGDIFSWWLRQMRSLTLGWRSRRAPLPDARIIALQHFGVEPLVLTGDLLIRRGGQESKIAVLDLGRKSPATPAAPSLGLRLPTGMVLHREVVLPLAAERDVHTALGYEMDRLTPFDADEVFWGISGLRRDPPRGLRLTLIVAPRKPVEMLLEALCRVDLRPTFLECEAGCVEMFAPAQVSGAGKAALYALCAGLALACLAIPVIRQQWELADTTRQIAALEPAQQEVVRLRGMLTAGASGEAAITAARRSGDALRNLAAVTSALPDGTWLSDLTLRSGNLSIDGQSGDAAKLISALAASGLNDPTFVAPVTRAINGAADLFSIQAKVAP